MKTKTLSAEREEDLRLAAKILKHGGLVAIPTETVYGLGANGLDPEAVGKIFAAKGRPQDNPLILHIAEAGQLSDYCDEIPEAAWRLAERFWPGPLTVVLKAKPVVPKTTTAGLDTVAMRCPQTEATREIIRLARVPVAAPSANLSGKPSTTTAAHVLHDMDGRIDAVVDGGPCRVGVESTIVDLTGERPRLLRPGGITPEALQAVLGELEIDRAVTAQISQDAVVRAPGMKYKHYAPSAEVRIVAGTREQAAAYIRHSFSPGDAVLCFAEELPLYEGLQPTAYGREDAPETLSAGLFAALRALDRPEIKRIFARCPEGGGIAYAVQNRLKKSAGFQIINPTETPPDPCPLIPDPCLLIGLTGPSGAGKTTALGILQEMGAAVYDCDAIYHALLQSDAALLREIGAAFPGTVQGGVLDRKVLGAAVFHDPEKLKQLNRLTHPAVERALWKRMEADRPRVAAIDAIGLLESGLAARCDVTVAVVAPEQARLMRLTARDGLTEEQAKTRMAAQRSAQEFEALCDITLHNGGTEAEFAETCRACFTDLLHRYKIDI